jgi:hypothetical protein
LTPVDIVFLVPVLIVAGLTANAVRTGSIFIPMSLHLVSREKERWLYWFFIGGRVVAIVGMTVAVLSGRLDRPDAFQ